MKKMLFSKLSISQEETDNRSVILMSANFAKNAMRRFYRRKQSNESKKKLVEEMPSIETDSVYFVKILSTDLEKELS